MTGVSLVEGSCWWVWVWRPSLPGRLKLQMSDLCFVDAVRSVCVQEGIVTYIDISTNPNLTPKEATVEPLPFSEAAVCCVKAVSNNIKIQTQNQVPFGFPAFVREGFDVKIIAEGYTQDENGYHFASDLFERILIRLIYKDVEEGAGEFPQDNQQVKFDYTGYNENGARIDSTYRRGAPAEVRLGSGSLIPGLCTLSIPSSRSTRI